MIVIKFFISVYRLGNVSDSNAFYST